MLGLLGDFEEVVLVLDTPLQVAHLEVEETNLVADLPLCLLLVGFLGHFAALLVVVEGMVDGVAFALLVLAGHLVVDLDQLGRDQLHDGPDAQFFALKRRERQRLLTSFMLPSRIWIAWSVSPIL